MKKAYNIILILILIFVIGGFVYHIINVRSKKDGFESQQVNINCMVPRPYPEFLGEIIVFGNNKWLTYDVSNTRIIKGTYGYNEHPWFKSLPEEFIGFDAICERPSDPKRELIIFKDNKWILWNFYNEKLEGGPFPITEHKWFAKLPQDFNNKIYSVTLEPGNKRNNMIFFKKHQYLIWNFTEDKIESGPDKLGSGKFQNLPISFTENIDSAYANPKNDTEIYLFSGNNFLK